MGLIGNSMGLEKNIRWGRKKKYEWGLFSWIMPVFLGVNGAYSVEFTCVFLEKKTIW